MNFNKKVIITKHAVERFEERKHEMRDNQKKMFKANPKRYLSSLLAPMNIKSTERNGKESRVTVKGNLTFVITETENANVVKTIINSRRKARRKSGAITV